MAETPQIFDDDSGGCGPLEIETVQKFIDELREQRGIRFVTRCCRCYAVIAPGSANCCGGATTFTFAQPVRHQDKATP